MDGDTDAEGETEGETLAEGLTEADGLIEGDSEAEGLIDGDSEADGDIDGLSEADGEIEGDSEADGDTELPPPAVDLNAMMEDTHADVPSHVNCPCPSVIVPVRNRHHARVRPAVT